MRGSGGREGWNFWHSLHFLIIRLSWPRIPGQKYRPLAVAKVFSSLQWLLCSSWAISLQASIGMKILFPSTMMSPSSATDTLRRSKAGWSLGMVVIFCFAVIASLMALYDVHLQEHSVNRSIDACRARMQANTGMGLSLWLAPPGAGTG